MAKPQPGGPVPFLPGFLYRSPQVADWEQNVYARRFWHPVAVRSELPEGGALTSELLGNLLVLTHPVGQGPRAFLNRCPHRGVALLEPGTALDACRKLICPYHGWTYGPDGKLWAAAREAQFCEPFDRSRWDLTPLACEQAGPFLWVRLPAPAEEADGDSGSGPMLADQLDLVREQGGWGSSAGASVPGLLGRRQRQLACNWKIAHDNTLDDYHVAIAHPTTLHRLQGPVSNYRHGFGTWCNLLATPLPDSEADGGEFLTFAVPPWNHLLIWPDGTVALIGFHPEALDRCRMELSLAGPEDRQQEADTLLEELATFLEEDRRLVESAQRAHGTDFEPGPAHGLERRILHHQAIYRTELKRTGGPQAAGLSGATPMSSG